MTSIQGTKQLSQTTPLHTCQDTTTATHIDEKRHTNGAMKTLGSVRNSFQCLSSDAEKSTSEHEHPKFTYLPIVSPKSVQPVADLATHTRIPTAFDIASTSGEQPASQPPQYVHPLQGKHVEITDGVRKGRRGLVLNKCTAHKDMFLVRIHYTGEIRRVPEHHMQVVTPQPHNPVVRGPPSFHELNRTFEEEQSNTEEMQVIDRERITGNAESSSNQRTAEQQTNEAVIPTLCSSIARNHTNGTATTATATTGQDSTSGSATACAAALTAGSSKRPRTHSLAPIGRALKPHPQLAAISTAAATAPKPAPPRILSKGDVVQIICGDYAGHTAQVRKSAKVGTHVIAGSHTVRVHNSVNSMVILPDNFLRKSAWGAPPVLQPTEGASSNTSSESAASSVQRMQQEAAQHSARSMGLEH